MVKKPVNSKKPNLADLLSVKEAAALIKHQPKTVSNWLSERKLQRFKVAGRTMVLRSELEAMVEVVPS